MYICMYIYVHGHVHAALVAQSVERSPRMRSVVVSNPTQVSFFLEKRESCPRCISLPLCARHVQCKRQCKRQCMSLCICWATDMYEVFVQCLIVTSFVLLHTVHTCLS